MDIGKLNKRITLQSRSATLDDYGQELNTWLDVATVWANVKPISGREKLRSMAIESELTHTVSIRYRLNFMPPKTVDAWRINYTTPAGVRIFNITSARDVDEERKYIIFDCTEGNEVGQ
jgi:SPP1 family predicted phage head-tail adaptor